MIVRKTAAYIVEIVYLVRKCIDFLLFESSVNILGLKTET